MPSGMRLRRLRSQLRGLAGPWVWAPGPRLIDLPPLEPQVDPLQLAAGFSYMVLKQTDPAALRQQLVSSTRQLLDADLVRMFEQTSDDELRLVEASEGSQLSEPALLLEAALARCAIDKEKSLISDHPRLYAELLPLAEQARRRGVLTHALLVRAHGQSHGVVCVHWIGRDRPGYEQRRGAYTFWDNVGLAFAASNERQRLSQDLDRLERIAHYDELTGLPNQRLLFAELEHRLASDSPVVLLHIDFDGMRAANNSLGYEQGGDFLIRTVGTAIPKLLREGELAARLHRAGDEFACLLERDADGPSRAHELELALDRLELPESHRPFYGGASVGWAVSESGDDPHALLGRAAVRMRERKQERHQHG